MTARWEGTSTSPSFSGSLPESRRIGSVSQEAAGKPERKRYGFSGLWTPSRVAYPRFSSTAVWAT